MNNDNNVKLKWFGLGKIIPYLKKYRKMALMMVGCGIVTGLIDISMPLFQRYSLNHFIAFSTLDTLPLFILLFLACITVSALNSYISCSYAMKIEVGVNRDLRNDLFTHLQTLGFTFFNQNSVGYIHSRIMSDSSRIGSLVSWSIIDSVWHVSYLIGSVIVMFSVNARLAGLVMLIAPVFAVLVYFFHAKMHTANRAVREQNSVITGNFNEGITGAKTIKSLVIEDKMDDKFVRDTQTMHERSMKAARWRGAFAVTMNLASSMGLAIVLWRGGYIAGEEVGTFSMFMSYAQGIVEPIHAMIETLSDLITTQVNIERVTRILETESNVTDTPEVIEKYGDTFNPKKENWEELKGDIRLEDVTFRYPDGDEYVLEHFNLDIPYGTNIAIVGETGAGKSTLANLVCRFYEPTEGRILIDGRDARERSQLWLHSSIGYVQQAPHLFSGTIRENLLYGNPDAGDEEINRALSLVSADYLVSKLENGLDTDIGEGGDTLSLGEKQLISFARAVISDPRILVLDEATASVDTIIEQKIQKAIDVIIHGRTSIVIAHRLSTVKNADIILVVKNGKIVEQGNHRELIKAHGYYYSLYTRQYEDEATSALLN